MQNTKTKKARRTLRRKPLNLKKDRSTAVTFRLREIEIPKPLIAEVMAIVTNREIAHSLSFNSETEGIKLSLVYSLNDTKTINAVRKIRVLVQNHELKYGIIDMNRFEERTINLNELSRHLPPHILFAARWIGC